MKTLFEKFLENPETQKLLAQLPKEEHGVLLEAIRKIHEEAEQNIIKPLEIWKNSLEQTKDTGK